jgi:hypothetical protein
MEQRTASSRNEGGLECHEYRQNEIELSCTFLGLIHSLLTIRVSIGPGNATAPVYSPYAGRILRASSRC